MELIRRFSDEQYAQGLESWGFLPIANKHAEFTSPFGDIFFSDAEGWWFLDLLDGTLTRNWATGAELQGALNTSEGRDKFVMAGLAAAAEARGIIPSATEVYDFTVAPVLGGPVDVDNVTVFDFVLTLDIAGQLHRQVRELPPGTTVSGITLS